MNTLMKRVISLILCFVLMTSCLPIGAIAQENGDQPSEGLVQDTDPSEEPTDPSEESSEPSEESSEPVVESVPGIALDVTSLKVRVGDEPVTLTATVTPEDAADVAITWTSSNSEVASSRKNPSASEVSVSRAR